MFDSPNTANSTNKSSISSPNNERNVSEECITDDARGYVDNGEFSSPTAVNQLGFAIQAGQMAADRLQYVETHSSLTAGENGDVDCESDVVKLHWEDILVEELLGVGGFCCVCLVRCKKLHRALHAPRKTSRSIDEVASSDESLDEEISVPSSEEESWEDDSDDIWLRSSTNTEPSKYFALKCLSNKTMASPSRFLAGATDLVGEAFYLRRLRHPNIVRIVAVTAGSTLDAFLKPGGYFLVVEAFQSILSDDMNRWRRMSSGEVKRNDDDDDDSSIPSLETRLKFSVDIARAMAYLHSKHVVFRDLKAQNCGIDDHGNVKLFDFGLAREVNEQGRYPGTAGSMRSLAPETILANFCCKPSDVYAFGLLLWELCTLRMPFESLSRPSEFKDLVAIGGARPPVDDLDQSITLVVETCWNSDLMKRPSFEDILQALGRVTS